MAMRNDMTAETASKDRGAIDERRFRRENGLAGRVADLVEPVCEDAGFRLVRVKISGRDGCTVQIMAERHDGTMTVEDCADLSRALSALLDVEDPVRGAYNLEISSPGIDRPLVSPADFARWAGHEAKLETLQMIDGRKRFRGQIEGVENGAVILAVEAVDGGTQHLRLSFDDISEARLVLTDALIAAALKGQTADNEDLTQ
jgi:ribosome maturation factor RimP